MTRRRLLALGPLLLVVVVAIVAVVSLWTDDGRTEPTAVELDDDAPRAATLEALIGASDLVVAGTVVDVGPGRTLTDPADPDIGITSQLAQVEVDDVLAGELAGPLVVEQEAALLDGPPVVVDGMPPLTVGEQGIMFLVRGTTDEFPYTAFVGAQGWVPVIDGAVAPLDPDDPVWAGLAGGSPTDVADRIRS